MFSKSLIHKFSQSIPTNVQYHNIKPRICSQFKFPNRICVSQHPISIVFTNLQPIYSNHKGALTPHLFTNFLPQPQFPPKTNPCVHQSPIFNLCIPNPYPSLPQSLTHICLIANMGFSNPHPVFPQS